MNEVLKFNKELDFNVVIKKTEEQQHEESTNHPSNNLAESKPQNITPEIVLPKHPTMRILTIFFKAAALITYFLLNWISNDSILTFILVSLFAALDFWVVKNITGRKLVGLRWWNEFKDDGSESWVFESYDSNFKPESTNSMFFWSSQILVSIVWLIFSLANLFTFRFFWVKSDNSGCLFHPRFRPQFCQFDGIL